MSRPALPVYQALPVMPGLRTKITQIRSLLRRDPLGNCVIAWSLSPDKLARAIEHKTPTGLGYDSIH